MADLSITAANVVPDTAYPVASNSDYNAGATVTAGQCVYLDTSNTWQLSDANGAAALRTVQGIAAHGASSGQPLRVYTSGTVLTIGATVAVGTIYVSSATAGGIAPSTDLASGWYTSIVGIAITAAKIKLQFNVSGVAVP